MTQSDPDPREEEMPEPLGREEDYAEMLLSLLPEDARAAQAADDLDGLVRLLDHVRGFEEMLALLTLKDRLWMVRSIAARFRKALDERRASVPVIVTTAAPLQPAELEQIAASLRESLGAEPDLDLRVDEGLIGGMVVQAAGRIYDGSVVSELRQLRQMLTGTTAAERPAPPGEGERARR